MSPPPSPTAKTGDSLREKAVLGLVGFLLTGVLGTMVTIWIQQRGWAWQNQVANTDKDTQSALGAYQSASDLINTRWHATYRMGRAIERGAVGDEWKAARDEFAAADKDWAIRYTSIARDVAFYVDPSRWQSILRISTARFVLQPGSKRPATATGPWYYT
jgi:hypothetical protein